jgi:hypothetical protein
MYAERVNAKYGFVDESRSVYCDFFCLCIARCHCLDTFDAIKKSLDKVMMKMWMLYYFATFATFVVDR